MLRRLALAAQEAVRQWASEARNYDYASHRFNPGSSNASLGSERT